MNNKSGYDFKFYNINYGKTESVWDLSALLYKGASSANKRNISQRISSGEFGDTLFGRLSLVSKIFEVINSRLINGSSRHTIHSQISAMRNMFSWIDISDRELNENTVESCFIDWTDFLIHKQRIVGAISESTVSGQANLVASILDEVLELNRGLMSKTRVKRNSHRKNAPGTKADKQDLAETFSFGEFLVDITSGLTLEKVFGSLPVLIEFRTGSILTEWSGLRPIEIIKTPSHPSKSVREQTAAKRVAWEQDKTWRTRYPLLNLRLEAELLIFIAQTGMNLSQAYKLTTGSFSYQSHSSGYQVRRVFKNRRQGEVEFVIYSEYRIHFENYLAWRKAIFGNDPNARLFPLASPKGRSEDKAPTFITLRKRCQILGIKLVSASSLRKTRVNWILRRSGDLTLTAELHQHSESTLLRNYQTPNHQRAAVEISQFIAATDPSLSPPGPGKCVKNSPMPIKEAPANAPSPDCTNPAGCLFCDHQRDVNNLDHCWSLVTYRYCKSVELSKYKQFDTSDNPAALAIQEITKRLTRFKEHSAQSNSWLEEATARVEEGDFHPQWDIFIRLMEA